MDEFLLIRLSALGDIVHALPAFASLRRHRPEARLTWVVSPKGREILDLVNGLDEILVVGSPGWMSRLHRRDRVALDFQGLLKSAAIGRLSGASRRLGFDRANLREPLARLFYTETLERVSENDHVILKNLRLLRPLGIEDNLVRFPLTIPAGLTETIRTNLEAAGARLEKKVAIFNVGAAWPTKRWFPDRWVETIRTLDRAQVSPVLLWGTPDERRTAEEVGRKAEAPVLPFLTVQEIFALLKIAALLVSGDTFALQAACAVGTPVVAIFGPTSPERNGPFTGRDKIAYHELPCGRCYRRECPNPKCLAAVTADEVSVLIRESLKKT